MSHCVRRAGGPWRCSESGHHAEREKEREQHLGEQQRMATHARCEESRHTARQAHERGPPLPGGGRGNDAPGGHEQPNQRQQSDDPEICQHLHEVVVRVLADPGLRKFLLEIGGDVAQRGAPEVVQAHAKHRIVAGNSRPTRVICNRTRTDVRGDDCAPVIGADATGRSPAPPRLQARRRAAASRGVAQSSTPRRGRR